MEDLLCDEVWLSSPETPEHFHEPGECIVDGDVGSFYVMTKEESEQALIMCLEKESSYMPKPQYVEYLHSNGLALARFGAVLWFIKSRARLNLKVGTVFSAVNYLDRFMSMSHCHRSWKCWMIELLSVACLSIASKFNETSTPPFHEIQMEGLEHSFQSSTIQRMELALMNALQWRLTCTTTYSYLELMISNIICNRSHKDLTNQVTKTLLAAQLDLKLLEYPPSVIAASAVQGVISSSYDVHLADITSILNQHQKDGFAECHKIMQAWLADPFFRTLITASDDDEYSCYCPSSPVTVLFKEPVHVDDCQVDLSVFKMSAGSDLTDLETYGKKRKKEEEE